MKYWLVKQEPDSYSWGDFVADGSTTWTGVRNFQARNNLRAMKRGDDVLFYASVSSKCVMGIAKVSREAFPDPTAADGDWSAVELTAGRPLKSPVTLEKIKASTALQDMLLVRHSRLSVMPVTKEHFDVIVELGGGA